MASYRRPKGSIARHLPDWNLAGMMSGGIQYSPIVLGDSHAFGVYNNSTRGYWLVLWDLAVTFQPSGALNNIQLIDVGHLSGHANQTLTAGAPLVATAGPKSGQTWTQANFQDTTDDFLYLPMQDGKYQWPHDWPLAAVPSGWSIVVITDGNAAGSGAVVNFVWEITDQL